MRETSEKIQSKTRRPVKQPNPEDVMHYPSTSPYQQSSLYGDLLRFAATRLKIGGRLVCWVPIYR